MYLTYIPILFMTLLPSFSPERRKEPQSPEAFPQQEEAERRVLSESGNRQEQVHRLIGPELLDVGERSGERDEEVAENIQTQDRPVESNISQHTPVPHGEREPLVRAPSSDYTAHEITSGI